MKKIINEPGIAPWKIDSSIERYLSKKADKSLFFRKFYVLYYRIFDHKYFKKGLSVVKTIIEQNKNRISDFQYSLLITDMIYCLHRFGCAYNEYFLFEFYNKNFEQRNKYITDKIRYDFYHKLNCSDSIALFNNKYETFLKFKQYYKREVILIDGFDCKNNFLKFVKKFPKFICKPLLGSGGLGICLYDINKNSAEDVFNELVLKKPCVIEEILTNSDDITKINPNCLNTLRLPVVYLNNEVIFLPPFFRIGKTNSCVDNTCSGGIFCLVNEKNGQIITNGFDSDMNEFVYHPLTKFKTKGFRFPEWENLKKVICEIGKIIPDNHYIGWDFAHTNKGWVLIEGNPRGQLDDVQFLVKDGFADKFNFYINKLGKPSVDLPYNTKRR